MPDIPITMRAVQLSAYDGAPQSLSLATVPVPRPGPGEVLVRMHAAPINPSDLMFVRGLYGFTKPVPAIPGFEGSGTVVESGPGLMAKMLNGKRVACAAADANIKGGTWAEYLVTSTRTCIPLGKSVDLEQAAMMLVNPLTAWALMEIARSEGHKAAVQTAAASALGRMVLRLGLRFKFPVIHVVRRFEQVKLLADLGARYVLDSSDPDFDSHLRELCHQLKATIGFDAVAGSMTAQVMRAQPRGSRLLVYGGLSLEAAQADPGSLIFEEKTLEGFWLSGWLRRRNMLAQLRIARKVQALLSTDLKSEVQARVPLSDVSRGLAEYSQHMTAGKVLVMPGLK
ncbi:MAG TPA: zinc-binding dehydrogenase [Candidatus Angelobacter sp.]|jgi:NADPH:quinone reductase-like Zn-dependent oxidoreductase|nr:zinc-binding dehydrogenase [Candidatus Angelobacter sp.]